MCTTVGTLAMRDALWSSVLLPPSSGEACGFPSFMGYSSVGILMYILYQSYLSNRFGSFEIFKQPDEFTGRRGPSCGLDEIRGQMMDYVIEMFYPEIQQNYPDRVERNVAFFREVRTHG